ncbi:MAG: response regulator transcription factor [Marinomonas sp.]|jgi:DNA-binding response OmpR family regulator|uniref:response regulator transcription factor n=1 Tax=unclassified Marinomonas TaxID=196814 RepID=UPI0005FA1FFD|nr:MULTISPECIES: response regulator transcription factor [unclassified Marinomonas]KJZ15640.1 XRE family transcriptional regulator [Marinomonas sp. S3726]KZM40602.1 XRE family transcriptional regulator [Marinomonas sp. SBI22]KZM42304.1 XRE family transcriptional regulator [Marinomonas sp. SBI8L]
MAINVLLIEDDKDLSEAISDYMELDGIEFDFAYNGAAGLNLALNQTYDIILTDLNMPKMDGIHVCQTLRQKGITTPILMLTARDTLDDKLTGFAAGSDDYLVKPFAMEELKVRLFALVRRAQGVVTNLTVGDLSIDLDKHLVTRAGQVLKMPPLCWKILVCLMQNSPNVVSKSKLEDQVWGDDLPNADSLKVHLFKLRQAIDAPFENKMIQTIHGVGVAIREVSK